MTFKNRPLKWSIILCICLFYYQPATADTFSILTLNLHGPHPMGQGDRYVEYPPGQLQLSWSNPFYFSQSELISGQANRDRLLTQTLQLLEPDLAFFQEVTAGDFTNPSCDLFSKLNIALPNPALRISNDLPQYSSYLACRGNRGWWTTPDTFKNQRVFKANQLTSKNLIFDYNANPYPNGLVIEGLAILTSPKIRVIQHGSYSLKINRYDDQFYFQWILFSVDQKKNLNAKANDNILALNLHQGHKLSNFEQNLMLQRWLKNQKSVINNLKLKQSYTGLIVAGDLNETLPSTDRLAERLGLIPWSVYKNAAFNFSMPQKYPERVTELKLRLKKWNQSTDKSWANINDPVQAETRINDIINQWIELNPTNDEEMFSSLILANEENKCFPFKEFWGTCQRSEMIDHIFFKGPIQLENSSIVFNHHNWTSTNDTLSDHPGIFSMFSAR